MKRGNEVAVCYDGKYGRRVKGVVTKQHNGHHITVRFTPWPDGAKEVDVRFRQLKYGNRKFYGGWARLEGAMMPMIFPMFGATAVGDYYTVLKWREK